MPQFTFQIVPEKNQPFFTGNDQKIFEGLVSMLTLGSQR